MYILQLHPELLSQTPGTRDEDGAALEVILAVGALGEEGEVVRDAGRRLDECRLKE